MTIPSAAFAEPSGRYPRSLHFVAAEWPEFGPPFTPFCLHRGMPLPSWPAPLISLALQADAGGGANHRSLWPRTTIASDNIVTDVTYHTSLAEFAHMVEDDAMVVE